MGDELKRVSALDNWRQAVLYRAAQAFGAALSRGDAFAIFEVYAEEKPLSLQVTASVHPVTSLLVLSVVEMGSGRFVCRSKPVAIDDMRQDDPGDWWDPYIDEPPAPKLGESPLAAPWWDPHNTVDESPLADPLRNPHHPCQGDSTPHPVASDAGSA